MLVPRKNLSVEECASAFNVPIEDAVARLGCSRPTINKVLRAYNIRRWPFRWLRATNRLAGWNSDVALRTLRELASPYPSPTSIHEIENRDRGGERRVVRQMEEKEQLVEEESDYDDEEEEEEEEEEYEGDDDDGDYQEEDDEDGEEEPQLIVVGRMQDVERDNVGRKYMEERISAKVEDEEEKEIQVDEEDIQRQRYEIFMRAVTHGKDQDPFAAALKTKRSWIGRWMSDMSDSPIPHASHRTRF